MTGAVIVKGATLATVLGALALAACDAQNRIAPPLTNLPRQLSLAEQELIEADNGFAFRLLREAVKADAQATNVFLSPLSVSVALGMTLNGAAGATADSLRATLGFTGMSQADINAGYRGLIDLLAGLDASVTWSLANSIWYRDSYTFNQGFLDATRQYFDAQVRGIDFTSAAAAPTINQWVSDATGGRITAIVPDPLTRDAIMYIINAIYFKGAWTTRFDPASTAPGPFQASAGTVQVPMMSHRDMPARVHFEPGYIIAELPYARQAYAMTIVMPTGNVTVDSLARTVTREQWTAWVNALQPFTGPVSLPKFTIRYGGGIKPVLAALGMSIAWCDGGQPDFSNMDPSGRACINDVQHKTFVQVDEAGTEAAAVTSVEVGVTSAPPEIRIARPFLFAIRERLSGTILFLGMVRNPVAVSP